MTIRLEEEQMGFPKTEVRILLLVLWVPITAIGWGAYTWAIMLDAWSSLEDGLRIGLLEGALIGLLLGVSQSLYLRAFVAEATRWILPTFLGLTLGGALGGVLYFMMYAGDDDLSMAAKGVFIGAVVGAVIGVCQWMILRVWVRGARRWILATIIGCSIGAPVGWVAGFVVSWPFGQLLGEAGWPYFVALADVSGSLASGAVLGLVTSFTLKTLFVAAEPKKVKNLLDS
jgi:hypothetical protein